MSQVFEGPTWAINVPDGWTVREEEDVITLEADPGVGALQISAYGKDSEVTHADLEEFAEEHLTAGAMPERLDHPNYDGFAISYEADGQLWTEWYLRSEHQMLYVTYTCSVEDEGAEDEIIEGMITSLAPTDGAFEFEDDDEDDDDDEEGAFDDDDDEDDLLDDDDD